MTDIELLDLFCETCLDFINPLIFREVENRGLGSMVNYLPNRVDEAKAVVRARMAKAGKAFGDPEIDKIAGEIQRLQFLRERLNKLNLADAHKVLPVLQEMLSSSKFVLNYYNISRSRFLSRD